MIQSHDLGGQSAAVSTIIPCVDDPANLRRAVQTVVSQEVRGEIIIVDDGSGPANARLIQAIGDAHGARVLRLDERSGPAKARNRGIDAATGRYIAFLDCDDCWMPGKLALQIAAMENLGLNFTYTLYANVSGDRANALSSPESVGFGDLARNTVIGCSTVVLRRDFVKNRRFPLAASEDFAFWMQLLKDGERAHRVGDTPLMLRQLGGRSRNRADAAIRHWQTLRATLQMPLGRATGYFASYAVNAIHKHWLRPLCLGLTAGRRR